jgi:hydrogenase large subunit
MTTWCTSTTCMRSTGSTWSALKADPKATSTLAQSISNWPLSSPGYFRDIQNRLKKFVESGQLGPFMNGYWGNPAYKLPPEANLMAVAHYLEALDFQKEIVKVHTIFGGKNPHPNWLVGGVPCAINLEGTGAVGAINMERLNLVKSIIDRCIEFVEQVYIPDLLAIAASTRAGGYGGGLSSKNVMSYGDIPDIANDYSAGNLLLPRGAIINGNLKGARGRPEGPGADPGIRRPLLVQVPDETKGLHPFDGVTEPNFELGPNTKGSKTNIERSTKAANIRGSRRRAGAATPWKSARWRAGHRLRPGQCPEFKEPVEVLKKLDVPVTALFSTLGRTAARGLEAPWAAHKMLYFFDKLMANLKAGDLNTANIEKWEPSTWPKEAKGAGFTEAPRGALGHWIKIKDTKIDNYQCVVPTTWNGGPRDHKGQIGAFEASADEHPGGQGRRAAGNPAHAAFLRPLPGLLDARDEPGRTGNDVGQGRAKGASPPRPIRRLSHALSTGHAGSRTTRQTGPFDLCL